MSSNGMLRRTDGEGYKLDRASRSNRIGVTAVMQSARPRLLIHGHMHHGYNDVLGETAIRGLGCNGMGSKSWALLDTERLEEQIEEIRVAVSSPKKFP